MSKAWILLGILAILSASDVCAENPYRYYQWTATYGDLAPLGTRQQVILINGQFPGPTIEVVTNDNIVLNLFNNLDEPFLLTWNGIKQRKNSWQDGVLGTNCPIPPGGNYTYFFQAKDQIGTFTYFPSTQFHKAAGGFGAFNVYKRPQIPLPYPIPDGDFTLLAGDWYQTNHKVLQQSLDAGTPLPPPDGLLINGQRQAIFTGDAGKTYRLRFSNVGLTTSLNVAIEGHNMTLVEVEGCHVVQNTYDSLDVHVGQSVAVLVTLDQTPRDYYIAVYTRFSNASLTASALLRYSNSLGQLPATLPPPPSYGIDGSIQQARSFRWNLTANAARPNPQGSYHYGTIPVTRTLVLRSSEDVIGGMRRFSVNGVSYSNPDTPLKLADYFGIGGVFTLDSLPTMPGGGPARIDVSVVGSNLHDFYEVVFENEATDMQTWHLAGYDFWVVGLGGGQWTEASRGSYNLVDAATRHTVQVYPGAWTAVLVSLDNEGMWNVRSAGWERRYLGQESYLRVKGEVRSYSNEYDIPSNALRCGKAIGH